MEINVIHSNKTFIEWISLDKEYVPMLNIDKIEKENDLIISELNRFQNSYEKIEGCNIYPPEITGSIYVLYKGLENRMKLLGHKLGLYQGEFRYNEDIFFLGIDLKNEFEIKKLMDNESCLHMYNEVKKILKSKVFPRGFLYNINLYLSPYDLKSLEAYTHSYRARGRGENIVLAFDAIGKDWDINFVLMHELGHVFMYDIIGKYDKDKDDNEEFPYFNEVIWNEYLKASGIEDYKKYLNKLQNPNYFKDTKEWMNSIEENMAEDFRCYMHKYNLGRIIKNKPNLTKDKSLMDEFIKTQIDKYIPEPKKSFPDVFVRFGGYVNKMNITNGVKFDFVLNTNNCEVSIDASESLINQMVLLIEKPDGSYQIEALTKEIQYIKLELSGTYNFMFCVDGVNHEGMRQLSSISKINIKNKKSDLNTPFNYY